MFFLLIGYNTQKDKIISLLSLNAYSIKVFYISKNKKIRYKTFKHRQNKKKIKNKQGGKYTSHRHSKG